jgi:hypothetical protein
MTETTSVSSVPVILTDPLAGQPRRSLKIAARAVFIGIKTGSLTNIPECPAYWKDVEEVWDVAAMGANVAKIMLYGVIVYTTANGTLPAALSNVGTSLLAMI